MRVVLVQTFRVIYKECLRLRKILEKRHGEKKVCSAEQFGVCGHMIQMKKHYSYDEPPDKPFFRHSRTVKGKTNTSLSGSSDGMSLAKRINLWTECINQMDVAPATKEGGNYF